MPSIVGILGGMGPQATILMMSRILAATPVQDDADHIPLLVDNNTRVPSRIAHLIEGGGDDPTPVLIEMASRLHAGGAQILAMPCNTAHTYYPAIAASVPIPMLNMVELTASSVAAARTGGAVGLLSSPAVEKTGIFERAFRRHDCEVAYPEDRQSILAAICTIKAGREEDAVPILRAAALELAAAGSQVAVIGCSEFSIVAPLLDDVPLTLVDSLDVLVEACVRFAIA